MAGLCTDRSGRAKELDVTPTARTVSVVENVSRFTSARQTGVHPTLSTTPSPTTRPQTHKDER